MPHGMESYGVVRVGVGGTSRSRSRGEFPSCYRHDAHACHRRSSSLSGGHFKRAEFRCYIISFVFLLYILVCCLYACLSLALRLLEERTSNRLRVLWALLYATTSSECPLLRIYGLSDVLIRVLGWTEQVLFRHIVTCTHEAALYGL